MTTKTHYTRDLPALEWDGGLSGLEVREIGMTEWKLAHKLGELPEELAILPWLATEPAPMMHLLENERGQ